MSAVGGVLRRACAAALVLALAGACGAPGASPEPRDTSSPSPSPTLRTAVVGVLVPLTGPSADSGRGALEAVRIAVGSRAAELARAGWQVEVREADDRGQASVGQQEATALADDPAVVAVVGSTTSVVDEGVQPILAGAGIAMVALGGGDPTLVARGVPPSRVFPTYFRLSGSDADIGTAAGLWAVRSGDRSVAVVDDTLLRHRSMTAAFLRAYAPSGGRSVAVSERPTEAGPSQAAVRRVLAARPASVFVAAPPDTVRQWQAALRSAGSRASLVTTDAVLPSGDRDGVSGAEWSGVVAVGLGADPVSLTDPRFPAPPSPTPGDDAEPVRPGPYAAAATNAANLTLDALVAASRSSSGTQIRSSVVQGIGRGSGAGVFGPVRFDRFGAVRLRAMGVWLRVGDTWLPRPAVLVGPGAVGAAP